MIAFACCFCGNEIEEPQKPKGLILNWGGEDSEEDWQQWWCHLECFIESIHESAKHFAWQDGTEEILL